MDRSFKNSFLPFLLFLLFFLPFLPSPRAAEPLSWHADFNEALKLAATNRPLLVQFTAPWCQYCRAMANTTLQNEIVVEKLESFTRISLNFDLNPELVNRFTIRGIPAFLVLTASQQEIARHSGFADAQQFSAFLAKALANAALQSVKQDLFLEASTNLLAALRNPEPATKSKAVLDLLEWAATNDQPRKDFAVKQLSKLAESTPALLLPGLTHPRLGARILTGNLLLQKLGQDFVYDPWDTPSARQAAQDHWGRILNTN